MQLSLSELRKLYRNGHNITEILKKSENSYTNTPEIIEVAYDLQAGSYISLCQQDPDFSVKYTSALVDQLRPWISSGDNVLDVGTGELTTFGPVMSQLNYAFGFACDLSLSRILAGRSWLQLHFPLVQQSLQPFVADLVALPFIDASVDVTWSSHALEPNHGREKLLISELLRITRKVLILFEPHYESACSEAKKRMQRLGYIRNLEATIAECGGELLDLIKLPVAANPLNHTHCFVVKPKPRISFAKSEIAEAQFVCPRSMDPLDLKADGCILSTTGLHAYPLVNGIPLLRSHLAFPFTHPEFINPVTQ
jgi:hypothetical protein